MTVTAGKPGRRIAVVGSGDLPHELKAEGPCGVGCGVCLYRVTGEDKRRHFLEQYEKKVRREAEDRWKREDPWVELARKATDVERIYALRERAAVYLQHVYTGNC